MLQQRRVAPAFRNAAVAQDNDLVRIDDGAEAVGNDQGRAVARQFLEVGLDLALGLGIERGGRLVEQQDRRRFEDGARDRDALLLAAGELQAALSTRVW